MNNRPMTMNNRQPVGSRDCEQRNAPKQTASALPAVLSRKARPGVPVPNFVRGPILSGAVFDADRCRKPQRD